MWTLNGKNGLPTHMLTNTKEIVLVSKRVCG